MSDTKSMDDKRVEDSSGARQTQAQLDGAANARIEDEHSESYYMASHW